MLVTSTFERSHKLSTDLDFVIIGAQKAGSTLLARGLGQHPDVWMPRAEVPIFRDPVYNPRRLTEFRIGLAAHSGTPLRGIKCPDYLARPEVPARLLDQSVRPKLIVSLRDPVARAISTYYWHMHWGLLPIEDPAIGLTKVLNGAYASQNPVVDDILEWGLYGKHLSHYFNYFERSEVCILFNDDLQNAPQRTFEQLFRFLGIDPTVRLGAENQRLNEGVYSKQRLRFLSLRNKHILYWNPDKTYANIRPAEGVRPRLVSWSVAAADRMVLAHIFSNDRPLVPPEIITQLRTYYLSDVELLEKVLQCELAGWK